MGFLSGKKKQTQTNAAYGDIKNAFGGTLGYTKSAGDALQALLGGDSSGLDAYKAATGFDRLIEEGSRGITGNAAASGLLRSGSTGKALVNYGNQMQNQYAGTYMDKLLALAGLGTQGGSLLASTADTTTTSKSKPGLGTILGGALSMAGASDRRLKTNIEKVGELPNGLGVYTWQYLDGTGPTYRGVMADEVRNIQPEALGPSLLGYDTVDYSQIKGL